MKSIIEKYYKLFTKSRYLIKYDLNLKPTINTLVLCFLVAIILEFIEWLTEGIIFDAFSILAILSILTAFILLKRSNFLSAKFLIVISLNLSIFSIIEVTNNSSYSSLFFVSIAISNIICSQKEQTLKIFTLFLPILSYLILINYFVRVTFLQASIFIATGLIIEVGLFLLLQKIEFIEERLVRVLDEEQASIKALVSSQKILSEQKQKLHNSNEELRAISDQLWTQNDELNGLKEELEGMNQELFAKNNLLKKRSDLIEIAKENIEEKAQELKNISEFKASFYANITHELRTPLNSIMILANILAENKGGFLQEKQVEFAQVIHKSGKDLLLLINDILDLSKVEAGKIELAKEDIKLASFINEIRLLFEQNCEKKQIQLNINLEEGLEKKINTDELRIKQIIKNFMSNAIKFTPEGGTILIDTKNTTLNEKACVQINVCDNGMGIKEENLEKIFKAFGQAEKDTASNFGGTGLGLSISLKLAKLLDAEIFLESEFGKGSTFGIIVPIGDIENRKAHDNKLITDDKNIIKNALVIEDNVTQNKVISLFLSQENINVSTALNGNEGLNKIKDDAFDLIVLDLGLPDMDGMDIYHHIRLINKNTTSFIIIFTAKDFNKNQISDIQKDTKTRVVLKSSNSNKELIDLVRYIHNNPVLDTNQGPIINKEILVQPTTSQNKQNDYISDKEFLIVCNKMRFGFSYRKKLIEQKAKSADIISDKDEFLSKINSFNGNLIINNSSLECIEIINNLENPIYFIGIPEDIEIFREKCSNESIIYIEEESDIDLILGKIQ